MFERRRSLALSLLLLILTGGQAMAGMGDIHPIDLPSSILAPTDTVTLRWQESIPCLLMVGPDPGQLDMAVATLSSGPGQLEFQPEAAGLTTGVWAACLVDLTGMDSSLPFFLFVEAPNAPVMVSPQNGGMIAAGSVQLSWETVLGVPYYHVLLSDQEIVIDEDENGDTVISGANIIWQAIVTGSSAEYGAWDPSGFFNDMNGTPPPLVPGPEYNWLVLNNYGNNPALTSTRQAGVSAFTVIDDSGLDAPELLLPAADDTLSTEQISFSWSEVPDASHYHFYLSRIVDSDESEGAVCVFDQISGQTLLDLPAASLLVDSRYLWKVFALDETGQGVASLNRGFVYEIAMAELKIITRNELDEVLPQVQVELTPLGGGGNSLPVFTGSGGSWSDELLPGDYHLAASKDGHESTEATVMVSLGPRTDVTLQLMSSPATLAGSVRDENQSPLPFAEVLAIETGTGEIRQVQAGGGGMWQLGVTAGEWELHAEKVGYHSTGEQIVDVEPGAYMDLPQALMMAANSSVLSGLVLTEGGLPIVAASVHAERSDGTTAQLLTGSEGLFQFNLDAGLWELVASKPGHVQDGPRLITLVAGEDQTLDPAFVLGAQAVILSGFVQSGGGVVGGSLVTAIPETGPAMDLLAGPQGDWQLSLAPGTWTLSASKDGYSSGAPLQLVLAIGGGQSGITLELEANPCRVEGVVSDGGAVLSGATVSNGELFTQSSWDGSYSLTLPAGEQLLECWLAGYASGAPLPLDLTPGQELTGLNFTLSPNAATVSGRVLSAGSPVVAATVMLTDGNQSIERTTDAGGAYSISALPGNYTLSAAKEGMDSGSSLSLVLGAGQDLPDQDLELTPATTIISGLITTAGDALRDVQIVASSVLGDYTTGSALDGAWALQLPAGAAWTLSVSKSGYTGEFRTTPLLATGESWIGDFDLSPALAGLTGTIQDEGGYPLGGMLVRAIFQSGETSQLSSGSGFYELNLSPGEVEIRIDELGYASFAQMLTLSVGDNVLNPILDNRFASITGTVRNDSGATLAGASLSMEEPGGELFTIGGDNGVYAFPQLLAGSYTLRVQVPGYAPDSLLISLAEEENAAHDWDLMPLIGTLDGSVSTDDGAPLAGVSMQLREGGQLLAQQFSDELGIFHFDGLPIDRSLSLSATLAGYSTLGLNPLEDLTAPSSGLSFELALDDGTIQGLILDAASGSPLAGASLSADDGAGHYGQATSDATGAFLIEGLRRTGLYDVEIDVDGWTATSLSAIAADGLALQVELTAAPARIHGNLYPPRSEPSLSLPGGSRIRGIPSDGGILVEVAVDALGAFSLENLLPGEYTLVFRVDGYLTDPRQQAISVTEGQNAGPYDFELGEAPLVELAIGGVGELDNDASALFLGSQSIEGGEQVEYPLAWSLSPPEAGELDEASGRFNPRSDYFGEVLISASHEASGLQAEKRVSVYARIEAAYGGDLDDGAGLLLNLPAGALHQDTRITVKRQTPSPIKRRAGAFRMDGEIFHFLPDGLIFDDEQRPELTLPLTSDVYNSRLAIGWWDPEALQWEQLEGVKGAAGLSRELEHFSDYALLVANEALGVSAATLTPNPFSPMNGGLEILFTLKSQSMAAPLVDIIVFNLLGDPVRRLLERVALPVGVEQSMIWDGLSDAGELARNGRYLVRIRVHDNSGEEETILQAVLIK